MADSPNGHFSVAGLQVADANPPMYESTPPLDEDKKSVARLKGEKANDNTSAELVKTGGKAIIQGLNVVLTAKGNLLIFLLTNMLSEGSGFPYLEKEKGPPEFQQLLCCLSIAHADSQPAVETAET